MNFLLVDLIGLVLIAAGLVIAFRKPGSRGSSSVRQADEDPRVYIRRIAGFMLAAFGLAITVMFTTFHFA